MPKIIVFIHGIGSNKNTWDKFVEILKKDNTSKNIEEYLPNITAIKNNETYYYLYEYNSKIIKDSKLRQFIEENKTGKQNSGKISIEKHTQTFSSLLDDFSFNFDNIDIISHSMGGIITLNMLCNILDNNSRLKEIINKCILYGTPINGSDEPEKLKNTLKLDISTDILNELKPDSTTILGLKQNIENCAENLKSAFNILYIAGDSDSRIIDVDKRTVEKFGQFSQVEGGHSELIQPQLHLPRFIKFKNFIFDTSLKENKSSTKKIRLTVVIPAGGDGGSLFPINQVLPKCLVTVGTKSMLQHIINPFYFHKDLFEKVIVITGKYSDAIEENITQGNYGDFVQCKRISGKTLPEALLKLKNELSSQPFLIHYNDILIEKCNWKHIYNRYFEYRELRKHLGMLLASRYYPYPLGIGVIKEGEVDTLLSFTEKPEQLVGDNLANLAIAIFEPELFNYMEAEHKGLFEDTIGSVVNAKRTISLYRIEKWHHVQDLKALYFLQNDANLDFLNKRCTS